MEIRLKKKSTPYGAKVPENKLSEKASIEPAPLPEKVVIPLQQNIGAPCQALVKKGDKVLTGQKIGDSEKFVSAPVHATVSGEVTGTTVVVNPPTGALVEALIITSDGEDKWTELAPAKKPEALSVKELLEKIREAAGPDIILWGGLPGVYFSHLYPEEILRQMALDVIEHHLQEHKFIMGVSDQVPPDGEIKRAKMITDLVEAYAGYG